MHRELWTLRVEIVVDLQPNVRREISSVFEAFLCVFPLLRELDINARYYRQAKHREKREI